MTDYQAELQRIDSDIAAMQAKAPCGALSADDAGAVRLLYRSFQRATLTGEIASLRSLDAQLDTAIGASSRAADLWLLKAHLALKRHRFSEAKTALLADPSLEQSLPAQLLRSDIDMQQGRYIAAREAIEAVISEGPTWDALARLAHFTFTMGDVSAADRLYAAAEDELTAKQMQTFAWLEAQQGWMHFQRGDQTRARSHYLRADKAYSGYWLIAERIAEVNGAQGHFSEALTAYQRLYAESQRPEWAHALGELYSLSGAHEEGARWKQMAYAHFVESACSGEPCYLHYLVDLCCELADHAQEAVEWARTDVALRSNFNTQGDLAWSLYHVGEHAEAVEWIDRALASGTVSARLYVQAGCIYSAIGERGHGEKYMRLALETNPFPAKATVPSRGGSLELF